METNSKFDLVDRDELRTNRKALQVLTLTISSLTVAAYIKSNI